MQGKFCYTIEYTSGRPSKVISADGYCSQGDFLNFYLGTDQNTTFDGKQGVIAKVRELDILSMEIRAYEQ